MLEIARALRSEARVIIMDEPTSSLTQVEVDRLFEVVRELQRKNIAVIYITHRLSEIAVLADRVVGLRDGRNSGDLPREQVSHDALVQLMVGRGLSGTRRQPHAPGDVALKLRDLSTRAYPEASVDLTVRRSEVVAIAGLLGAGRSELLRAIFGIDDRLTGSVEVAGNSLPGADPRKAVAAGVALLPEDRKSEGLVLSMSVAENLSLPTLHRRGWWLDRGYQTELATSTIADLGIACRDGEQMAGSLSGGNQQKIVLGKWLAADPQVLLLDEPTRGVDVGARAEIYRRLDELAQSGLAVLFVSSELEEVLLLADRVLVMRDGEIRGEVSGDDRTEKNIMLLATGATL
jgi:ribose transport system ATP-binding protein